MLIVIGSMNEAKVLAAKEEIMESSFFSNAQLLFVPADSHVCEQPMSLQETMQGAKNRAKHAFNCVESCNYSFGIESGLMEAPEAATGFFNICAGCIYDGEHYYTGLSTGFEVPPQILSLILEKKMDLSQACLHAGISSNANIGSTEGLIGILTKGKIDRKAYSRQCIAAAILQLENAQWYAPHKVIRDVYSNSL